MRDERALAITYRLLTAVRRLSWFAIIGVKMPPIANPKKTAALVATPGFLDGPGPLR